MSSKKINLLVLFGGRSAEHEVSIQSAKNVVRAINKQKYKVILAAIDKKGGWHLLDSAALLKKEPPRLSELKRPNLNSILQLSDKKIDVVFPILHGPYGEDGTVQGLFKLADIPYVGAGVLGSAIGMDKDVMKRLLQDAGMKTANFLALNSLNDANFGYIRKNLGLPFFIKPANLGSSVGVHKIHNKKEFKIAVRDAFQYDRKILAEEYIEGREIECSVLGNKNPVASIPGEVISRYEFYSYQAKYLDENGAKIEIPAKLPKSTVQKIQGLAIKTFTTLCCEGMARVDFFLRKDGKIFVNEINTIPGFTNISMFPKLWEFSGISYAELIDRLIKLAFERYNKEKKLKFSFQDL